MKDVFELTTRARPSCFSFLSREICRPYNETPTLKGPAMNQKLVDLKNKIVNHAPEIIGAVVATGVAYFVIDRMLDKHLVESDTLFMDDRAIEHIKGCGGITYSNGKHEVVVRYVPNNEN